MNAHIRIALSLIASVLFACAGESRGADRRQKIFVTSSIDGTEQPCYLILPEGFDTNRPPTAILVSLHTWSGDVEQRDPEMEREAEQRGWIYLWPHFRGRNNSPDACGSEKAQQDPKLGRAIYLRRGAGKARVTIFEGGHERIAPAAAEWLSRHVAMESVGGR